MGNMFLTSGNQGMLIADTGQAPVEVVDYCGKALRIRFVDKPLVGGSPWCWLDFQNGANLARYYTQVCAATFDAADGMVLVRVPCLERNGVREFARVPAEATVVVEDGDGNRHEADLANLSSGGALVESETPFSLRSTLTLYLDIPNAGNYAVGCQVVHVDQGPGPIRRYGLRFVEVDRTFLKALFEYLWQRLKELFPMQPRTS